MSESQSGYSGPGRYRHHKGGEYDVLGLALREDSIDKMSHTNDQGETFVIYRPLTPGSLLERRAEDFWARRLDDFNAMVEREHGMVPRFVKEGRVEVPTWSYGAMTAAGFEWVEAPDGMSGRWADPDVAQRLRTAEQAVKALSGEIPAWVRVPFRVQGQHERA